MKPVLALIAMLLLSACEQDKTQDYYLAHPAELAADLKQCKETGKNTYNCNEADKAAWILGHKGEAGGKTGAGN